MGLTDTVKQVLKGLSAMIERGIDTMLERLGHYSTSVKAGAERAKAQVRSLDSDRDIETTGTARHETGPNPATPVPPATATLDPATAMPPATATADPATPMPSPTATADPAAPKPPSTPTTDPETPNPPTTGSPLRGDLIGAEPAERER